jgi:hypothetical protein
MAAVHRSHCSTLLHLQGVFGASFASEPTALLVEHTIETPRLFFSFSSSSSLANASKPKVEEEKRPKPPENNKA